MSVTIIIFSFIFIWLSHQSLAQMTEEEYYAEKEKLSLQKNKLKSKIETQQAKIDILQNHIPELEQKLITQYRELYVLKYGDEIGQRIASKRIWKEMTDEMVRDGWGEPDRVDKNVEAWGIFTQWNYGDVTFFFKDGKLTDWEGEEEKISN